MLVGFLLLRVDLMQWTFVYFLLTVRWKKAAFLEIVTGFQNHSFICHWNVLIWWFFSVTFDFITSCHCLHAWKTTPITFIICVLMLSSRTNRLCSQTNLPQKSPLASNPTSERLWCCHLVGSPSKKTERSQRKGERRERREGEKEKQMICHDWSDACEEETPQPSWCVTPIWRRAGSNSISKLDVFNRMQGMEGDDNFLSLPHTCTHYLLSWGNKGGHRVSPAINPTLSAPHLRSVQTAHVGARAW